MAPAGGGAGKFLSHQAKADDAKIYFFSLHSLTD
jgi:hypothetical protein